MRDFLKRFSVISFAIFLFYISTVYNLALAQTPQQLYDRAWKLIDAKYVDQTNNMQDWNRWRHKYDNKIQTDEDAYIAIETMVLLRV